jgi:hypothetical protein
MFDIRSALPPDAMAAAIHQLYTGKKPAIGSICPGYPFIESFMQLRSALQNSPEWGVAVEALMARLEFDASLVAAPAPGLGHLFDVCEDTRRRVVVISDIAEAAVVATLESHGLAHRVDAVVARVGADLDAFMGTSLMAGAVAKLRTEPGECLQVSGYYRRLRWARELGTLTMGCECRRQTRKQLAMPETPVVRGLPQLSDALHATR